MSKNSFGETFGLTEPKYEYYRRKYGSPFPLENYISENISEDVPVDIIRGWYQDYPDHDFDDVIGMDELKDYFRNRIHFSSGEWTYIPKKYGNMVQGYLFYGPYGTGKSFFSEAVAMEFMKQGFKFLRFNPVDLCGKYIGQSEKRLLSFFREAADCAPCVLYFDNFDYFFPYRTLDQRSARITNTFIRGFLELCQTEENVIILGNSNYPQKIDEVAFYKLFDDYFLIPLPQFQQRKMYFQEQLKKFRLSENISFEYMADITDNFSMRDLDKVETYIKNDILENAKEKFGIKDENGDISPELSGNIVSEAISSGKIVITKELFEETLKENPPTKMDDVIEQVRIFEKKWK